MMMMMWLNDAEYELIAGVGYVNPATSNSSTRVSSLSEMLLKLEIHVRLMWFHFTTRYLFHQSRRSSDRGFGGKTH